MEKLFEYVKSGKADDTVERVEFLLGDGIDPEQIMSQALIPAMDEVGDLFQKGEYFVPEMMAAARAMTRGLELIKPKLTGSALEPIGKVVMGTVKGDLHDIGKNLVIMSLEGAGFEVVDLGIDVPPDKFVEAVKEHKPQVLGLSALLSTTMEAMKDTVDAIKESGLNDRVKIMVGGAVVNQEYADEIGADFYGPDSTSGRDFSKKCVSSS